MLKSTTDTFLKKSRIVDFGYSYLIGDENLMKTRIMDLIDENENKDVLLHYSVTCRLQRFFNSYMNLQMIRMHGEHLLVA